MCIHTVPQVLIAIATLSASRVFAVPVCCVLPSLGVIERIWDAQLESDGRRPDTIRGLRGHVGVRGLKFSRRYRNISRIHPCTPALRCYFRSIQRPCVRHFPQMLPGEAKTPPIVLDAMSKRQFVTRSRPPLIDVIDAYSQ